MAIRKWSIRNIRWKLAGQLIRATPLHRYILMYTATELATHAGTVVDTHQERIANQFTPDEHRFIGHLPKNIRLQNVPDTTERDVRLLSFANHTLLGNTGSLVNEQKQTLIVFRSSVYGFANYHSFRPTPLRAVRKDDGIYLNMLGSWRGHRHLFHFLIDRFPRVFYALEQFGWRDRPLKLVVHADMPKYQEDVYAFLCAKYPTLELARIPPTERWQFDTLLCVDYWQNTKLTLADPALLAFIGDLYRNGYEIGSPDVRRRLYISREDAKLRRLENEQEIQSIFRDFDFEIVQAAKRPFREQVDLFAKASVVAGVHGAGMTNILFSPTDTKILEFFPSNRIRNTYFLQSRSMGMPYSYVIGSPAHYRERFSVCPDDIRNALCAMHLG